MAHHRQGRLAEALAAYRAAIAADPANAAAYPLLGMAQKAQGDTAAAVASFREAVRRRPGDPPLLAQLSGLLVDNGQPADAIAPAREAIALAPRDVDLRFALARACFAAGEAGRGSEANREALRLAHEIFPRLAPLAAATRRALELDPRFTEAWRTLSMMVRRAAPDEELAAMERLHRDPTLTDEQRMHLAFALGRACDDLGRWDDAARYFIEANRLKRAAIDFSIAAALDDIARLRALFAQTPALPERRADSAAPIFVVGLPRSGKTTVEQLLARHPQVAARGELDTLGKLVRAFIARHRLDEPGADLRAIPMAAFAELGADYLRLSGAAAAPGKRTVDTMPANFRYIGFLRLALPGARIVNCVRDPLEHALALFQKYFASPAYDYAYDMGEIEAYRGACAAMLEQWRRQFPGFIRDVDLAGLSADPESQLRGLLDFCGLAWDPACLDLRNIEQRIGEPAGLESAHSPPARLDPYSAILPPSLRRAGPSAG